MTEGLGGEVKRKLDITFQEADAGIEFNSRDTVVLGMPVYGGRLPDLALSRIDSIQGHGALAVIAVVYGNRAYEDALLELKNLMTDKGFLVIAAGAFIGEHSFSRKSLPIAENRPHQGDLQQAFELGQNAGIRIDQGGFEEGDLSVPGHFPYKEKMISMKISPETSEAECTKCMKCIFVCPSRAIDEENPLLTDPEVCIRCAACIKICGFSARAFTDPRMEGMARKLHDMCGKPESPEVFILS